jgi:hypothetical protein
MLWKVKNESSYVQLSKSPIVDKFSYGMDFIIGNATYSIDLTGIFSVRKRKVVSLGENKEIYRITVKDINFGVGYVGVVEEDNSKKYTVYPLIKSFGFLFQKINKKLIVNKNKQKIEFSIDSFGKFLG